MEPWSPGALHFLARSPGALNPFETLSNALSLALSILLDNSAAVNATFFQYKINRSPCKHVPVHTASLWWRCSSSPAHPKNKTNKFLTLLGLAQNSEGSLKQNYKNGLCCLMLLDGKPKKHYKTRLLQSRVLQKWRPSHCSTCKDKNLWWHVKGFGLTSSFLVTTVRAVGSRFEAESTSFNCASCWINETRM